MRLSEFWVAVDGEFGSYGRTLVRDLALTELNGMTADQAIRDGRSPRDIWVALCKASDVPAERWYGPRKVSSS